MSRNLTQYINTEAYKGGQILIQTSAWVGHDIKTVSRRAKVSEIRIIDESTLEIECEWVALKKGKSFHLDPHANPIMTVEVHGLEVEQFYTMILYYDEGDVRQSYKFMEPGHQNIIPDTKVVGLRG